MADFIINESLWTQRRERAPLVWKVEKIDSPVVRAKNVIEIPATRPQTSSRESISEADVLLAA